VGKINGWYRLNHFPTRSWTTHSKKFNKWPCKTCVPVCGAPYLCVRVFSWMSSDAVNRTLMRLVYTSKNPPSSSWRHFSTPVEAWQSNININEGSPFHPNFPPWIFSSPCFLLSGHCLRYLSISPYWFYLLHTSSPSFYYWSTRKVFCHPVRVVSLFWETSFRFPSSNGWSTWNGRRSLVTPFHSQHVSLLRSFRSHLLTKLCWEPRHCAQYT